MVMINKMINGRRHSHFSVVRSKNITKYLSEQLYCQIVTLYASNNFPIYFINKYWVDLKRSAAVSPTLEFIGKCPL